MGPEHLLMFAMLTMFGQRRNPEPAFVPFRFSKLSREEKDNLKRLAIRLRERGDPDSQYVQVKS
jgi:hypothetical protein